MEQCNLKETKILKVQIFSGPITREFWKGFR